MRLNHLVLQDFGLYRGRQDIPLAPRLKHGEVRPVILVGGHNGAGKTTILEAIRLCLYGRLALGSRVREVDYTTYLRERVHRNPSALLQPNSASVAIEFDYARGGVTQTFLVERYWSIQGEKVSEDLAVYEGGKLLDEVDSEFWPDFLRSLVPPGLSQLFFFDGEKIQKLAEDEGDAGALADSVKSLLGLDLVERLQADLDLYLSRSAKKSNAAGQATRLPDLEKETVEAEKLLSDLTVRQAELRTKAEAAAKELERLESALAMGGYGLAERRVELSQRRARLSARYDEIGKGLRELCEGPLPVAACPTLAKKVVAQLRREARAEQWYAAHEEVERALGLIGKRVVATAKKLKLGSEATKFLRDEISATQEQMAAKPVDLDGFVLLHGVSAREREEVERAVENALGDARTSAVKACGDLVKLERQLTTLQEKLNKAPEDDELAPKIRELSALHSQESDARAELKAMETRFEDAAKRVAALQRERKRLLDAIATSGNADKRAELAGRTRAVLDKYLGSLTELKVKELEAETIKCFNLLCRKEYLVARIHIDPSTFSVQLSDREGSRLPKSALSAGEKQIYAISVLWALARVSGRPLPMIIDTPLGRLDSIHRQRLVEGYFPHAAHQVIILSTDTEVDAKYFEALRPHMSHAIQLIHAPDGWTQAQPGYFWKEGDDGAAAA